MDERDLYHDYFAALGINPRFARRLVPRRRFRVFGWSIIFLPPGYR